MAEPRTLVGRVTLRSLPVLDRPPAQPVLDGVRIRMAAGEAAPVFNGTPFRFVAYLEFLPDTGAWRGNHFHEKKREAFYVIRGRLEGVFENVDTGERERAELGAGDVLMIEPRCAHAFRALEYAQVIECGTQDFDPADAFAHPLGRD